MSTNEDFFTETDLTKRLYVVRCIFSLAPIISVLIILLAWHYKGKHFHSRRLFFSIYASTVNCLAQLCFFLYYVIRLSNVVPSRESCDVFSVFLFVAEATTISVILFTQLHALFGSVAPKFYEFRIRRNMFLVLCGSTLGILHGGDLIHAVISQDQIRNIHPYWLFRYPGLKLAIDQCRHDFYARWSPLASWYLLIRLCLIGLLFLIQFLVGTKNKCMKRQFDNPVVNSPFSHWQEMRFCERVTSVVLVVCSIFVTVLYVVNGIIFLLYGNSQGRQYLSLSSVFFSILTPLQIGWYNLDIRRALVSMFAVRRYANDRAQA